MKTAREIAMAYCGERDPLDLELEILRHMEHNVMIEREACAKIADNETFLGDPFCCIPLAKSIAEKIRNRT